jgi:hypothetical protein
MKNFCCDKILSNKQKENKHLIVSFRGLCSDSTIFTLGQMIRVDINQDTLNFIINKLQTVLSLKDDGYKNKSINSIYLHYGFIDGKAPLDNRIPERSNINQNYRHYKLPITLDPFKHGILIFNEIKDNGNLYILQSNNGNIYKIIQYLDPITNLVNNNVEVIRNGVSGLIYNDQELRTGIFTRVIGSNKYYCSENKGVEFFQSIKQNNFIKTLNKEVKINQDIITLDLETYMTKNNDGSVTLVPYLISFYDGVSSASNYLTNFKDHKEMILDLLNKLVIDNYDGYKVYAHNLSNFDSLFLLDILNLHFNINIIRNKGRLISIKVSKTIIDKLTKKEKVIKLTFYDSYQLLPSSLRKLTTSFNTNTKKDIFPYDFVTQFNLNYIGVVPNMNLFPIGTFENIGEYQSYASNFNNNWEIKDISTKYCLIDCISLHQVLIKFSDLIWDKYHVNITKYPTLTSLTFSIFRTHFLGDIKIPMLAGKFYTDLKMAYTGGATDMYIPSNITFFEGLKTLDSKLIMKFIKLFYFDVNSLYPYIMSKFELPTGKIVYFEGDIYNSNLIIDNFIPDGVLGFYYCKVIAPDNLVQPIIQIRYNNKTIAPIGTFECMLYSEEILNAIKYGYEIQVLRGYYFTDKTTIFKEYILELYSLRLEFSKNHPMNLIAKLLMNSLYGRFGMDYSLEQTSIQTGNQVLNLLNSNKNTNHIVDIEPLGNSNFIVTQESENISNKISSLNHNHNINVAIAAAVTSLARIEMSKFKNNDLIKIFYTDTDSIFVDKSPMEMKSIFGDIIGEKLGQLKLEYILEKCIFLAPKAYYYEQQKINKSNMLTNI